MDTYLTHFDTYTTIYVYHIDLTCGIGDFIKFFMFTLSLCIHSNIRLYYKIQNIELEKHIKLKHPKMYITDPVNNNYIDIHPTMYYATFNNNFAVNITDVFYFSDEVITRSHLLFPITNYISLHIRLGDNFLETDKQFVICHHDSRSVSNSINSWINSQTLPIFLCCDQNTFKQSMKEKYKHVLITNCSIGHSGLSNTTSQQILDSVAEFYILSNSKEIYCNTYSGFSSIASILHHIPYTIM